MMDRLFRERECAGPGQAVSRLIAVCTMVFWNINAWEKTLRYALKSSALVNFRFLSKNGQSRRLSPFKAALFCMV